MRRVVFFMRPTRHLAPAAPEHPLEASTHQHHGKEERDKHVDQSGEPKRGGAPSSMPGAPKGSSHSEGQELGRSELLLQITVRAIVGG